MPLTTKFFFDQAPSFFLYLADKPVTLVSCAFFKQLVGSLLTLAFFFTNSFAGDTHSIFYAHIASATKAVAITALVSDPLHTRRSIVKIETNTVARELA